MKYVHYGKGYKDLITKIPANELEQLGITSIKYMVPFNPVVAPDSSRIRIAFFGINAYSNPEHYDEIGGYRNFLEEIQESYYTKLFKTIDLYRQGINQEYFDGGSVYFSNFIKIVLREDMFMKASDASKAMNKCPEALNLHKCAAKDEISALKKQGCRLFICLGHDAYNFISSSSPTTPLIWDYHFSYRRADYTKNEIGKINRQPRFA